MIALALGALLVGAASACGAALLRPGGRIAFALGIVVIAYAEIVAISHGLSFVDAYERKWFLVVSAAVALAAVHAAGVVRPAWPSLRVGAAAREILGDRVVAALAAVVTVELGYLLALALATPPNDFDGLTYHLMRGALWIQQGSVSPVGGIADTRIDEFPPDAEILQAWTMLLSDSARFAQLVAFGALVATVLAIHGVARRVGFDRRAAAFGALVFATLPIVALQAATALTDIVVAGLVVAAAFFVLGRTPGELALAFVAVALLVGTKVTGLLSLPLLLAIALLVLRGRRLGLALAGGAAASLVGGAWFAVNLTGDKGAFGSVGREASGADEGVAPIAARVTRSAVQTLELPGATGKDALLYVLVAAVVAIAGVALARPQLALAAAAFTALPLTVLLLEPALHRVHWRGWELLGQDRVARFGSSVEPTRASNATSWFGPLGLALSVVALALVVRAVRRRSLTPVALVLAIAPAVLVVGTSIAIGYHIGNGRYLMAGVALSAATWGIARPFRAASAAVVAVAATTLALSFVHYEEKPAGLRLLEPARHESVWGLAPEWAQNVQPELVPITREIRSRAVPGGTIALTRDPVVRPFVYVGWPRLDYRIAYADTLAEATQAGATWAVLPDDVACKPGWRLQLRSAPWAVYRHLPRASCR